MNSQIENGPLFVISPICFLNGYLDMWGVFRCISVFQYFNLVCSSVAAYTNQPGDWRGRYCCNKIYVQNRLVHSYSIKTQ